MHVNRRRFFFLSSAAGVAAGLGVPGRARAVSPGEKIVLGVIGVRGRGGALAEYLAGRPDAEVAYVCDVDEGALGACAANVERVCGRRPKAVADFRRILDAPDVHAIVNATPDHWHAIPVIMACQAGKDSYVEKPASHNLFEGRKMVEASRKYGRVVQLGTQNRSAPYMREAIDYIRSGGLGEVNFVRVVNLKDAGTTPVRPDGDPPAGVDYDAWLGPAPLRPFNPSRFHGGWYYQWDYSGGDLINDGVHQVDIARWIVGQDAPRYTSSTGGRNYEDARETPDVQVVTWQFEGVTVVFEMTLRTPYMVKIPLEIRDGDAFPDWTFCTEKLEIFGTKGLMILGRHGGGWQVFAPDHSVARQMYGRVPLAPHMDDFFESVRSRRAPNADILEGHRSTALCQLGNISYRLGGRRIEWDAATETIVGDPEADAMRKRPSWREPWVVKDEV